ncbi:MAG: hypothetical protein FWC71_11955 [Defluviitaleaceae bacterium]|nr:hypothetical protein [Defluviitaleaceae bacterium]
MYINVTIKQQQQRFDIRIDSEQNIIEGLKVLTDSGKLPADNHTYDYFRSFVRNTLVSANKTFAQEFIYDGDILEAVTPND